MRKILMKQLAPYKPRLGATQDGCMSVQVPRHQTADQRDFCRTDGGHDRNGEICQTVAAFKGDGRSVDDTKRKQSCAMRMRKRRRRRRWR
jgi:hypothetical protein